VVWKYWRHTSFYWQTTNLWHNNNICQVDAHRSAGVNSCLNAVKLYRNNTDSHITQIFIGFFEWTKSNMWLQCKISERIMIWYLAQRDSRGSRVTWAINGRYPMNFWTSYAPSTDTSIFNLQCALVKFALWWTLHQKACFIFAHKTRKA